MPFYEYECSACKFYLEVLQKISDAPLTKCPSCGKESLARLISAPVFRLKGGGWYETDFKSDKENKRNLVGEDKESASSDSDDKKTKVRASKALKKAVRKTAAKTAAGKSASKSAKKSPGKPVKKTAKKPARKVAKVAAKKLSKKTAAKPVKKPRAKPAKKK